LDEEVEEVVVLLLIIGTAKADPASAARTKDSEACIFIDNKEIRKRPDDRS
jgi:hypothetical protein